MELYHSTWPEVEAYLKHNQTIIIPIGSTEQHGPTGTIGIDFLTSWEIAKSVGEKTKTLVASPICYGMALHHMAFPGSAALKPSTYLKVIVEVTESFYQAGFRKIIFINGHGGNIPTVQAAFSEFLGFDRKADLKLINWWHLPSVRKYEEEHFGEKNGFHATAGEISVTMHIHPNSYTAERAFTYFDNPRTYSWPQSPVEFKKTFPDGRMASDPRLANANHGKVLFNLAVESIAHDVIAK